MATQKKISQLPEVALVGDEDLFEVSVKTGPSSYVSRMVQAQNMIPSGVVLPSGLALPSGIILPEDTVPPSGWNVTGEGGGGGGTADWTTVEASKYTATPASTSVINMSDTSNFKAGLPVKYTYNGNTYWGRVQTLTTNTSIAIQGPPLNTGQSHFTFF